MVCTYLIEVEATIEFTGVTEQPVARYYVNSLAPVNLVLIIPMMILS